jgi:hypothetical protein
MPRCMKRYGWCMDRWMDRLIMKYRHADRGRVSSRDQAESNSMLAEGRQAGRHQGETVTDGQMDKQDADPNSDPVQPPTLVVCDTVAATVTACGGGEGVLDLLQRL